MENILVGIELHPNGQAVAEKAIELAKRLGARVTLAHVINNMVMHTATFPDPLGNLDNMNVTTDLQILEEQQKVVDTFLNELKSNLDYPVETKILYGELEESLLDYAAESNADLLVIGSHSSSSLLRFLEGDLSASIIHHAKIPLMIIPSVKQDK